MHRMEQHALLHRRQWIDVLDLAPIKRKPVEFGLTQPRQRHVRWCQAASAAGAVIDQLAQRSLVQRSQPLDRLAPIALAAEPER